MSSHLLNETEASGARPIWLVGEQGFGAWLEVQPPAVRSWVRGQGFQAEKNKLLLIPTGAGDGIAGAVLGLGPTPDLSEPTIWTSAGLPDRLPPGRYRFAGGFSAEGATHLTLGWEYGSYRFTRYRKPAGELPSLVAPSGTDLEYVRLASQALAEARDLINTPANDMGPAELGEAVQRLALQHEAECRITVGEELLRQNYPLIYEVGKGSAREPRLIDMRWGKRGAPQVTLVGKGVCFDTGGLDIKPSSGMILMKKDMGGAALVLALARMLMDADAPIQLRLLIPAVENSISGRSYRPSDVLRTRLGLTVEIGNTDAEGRLVLADALAEADREQPELLVDLATLTGAARVALGPELPAIYSNPTGLAEELRAIGERESDPMWPMPLWGGYEDDLASRIADLNNVSNTQFAGSIIGALFLKRFVIAHAQLAARRRLRLEPQGTARPAGGSGSAHRARAVSAGAPAVRVIIGRTRPESLAAEAAFRREIAPWALLGVTLGLVEGATAAVLIKKTFADAARSVGRESRRCLREWCTGVVQRGEFRVGESRARPRAHRAHGGAAGGFRIAGGLARCGTACARRTGVRRGLDSRGARDLDRHPYGARRGVERELSAPGDRALHRPHRHRQFPGGVLDRGARGLGAR